MEDLQVNGGFAKVVNAENTVVDSGVVVDVYIRLYYCDNESKDLLINKTESLGFRFTKDDHVMKKTFRVDVVGGCYNEFI